MGEGEGGEVEGPVERRKDLTDLSIEIEHARWGNALSIGHNYFGNVDVFHDEYGNG